MESRGENGEGTRCRAAREFITRLICDKLVRRKWMLSMYSAHRRTHERRTTTSDVENCEPAWHRRAEQISGCRDCAGEKVGREG